jgi:hypothetical protein
MTTPHLIHSRRFFIAVAAVLAALLMVGASAAIRNAQSATVKTVAATQAFSGFHDSGVAMPNSLAKLVSLNIPTAGSYVIHAKLSTLNNSSTASVNDRCVLIAGGNFDEVRFDVDAVDQDDSEPVALQVVHTFPAAGQATLSCTDLGKGDVIAQFIKITATPVASLSDVQI